VAIRNAVQPDTAAAGTNEWAHDDFDTPFAVAPGLGGKYTFALWFASWSEGRLRLRGGVHVNLSRSIRN